MVRVVSGCLAIIAALSASAVLGLSNDAEDRLRIGNIAKLNRPDGFVVEDLRTEAMKTPSRVQTYRRPTPRPFEWSAGPLAKYRRNFGDAELNVSPVDLLAERLIERYGDKLTGKKLVVHEFSFVGQETIEKPQGMTVVPLDPASVGAAIVGSALGTALLQSGSGGQSFRIEVKITAELDGKPFTGSDFLGIGRNSDSNIIVKIVNGALDIAFQNLEQPKLEDVSEQVRQAESAKQPDVPSPPAIKADQTANESTETK